VVGINTAINAAGQGIGFAIPINMVKPILPQLVEKGEVSRSWLGVSIQKVTGPLAQAFGLPDGPAGALVTEVVAGSPADGGGIAVGDVILAFGGEKIDGIDDLSWLASTAGESEKVEVGLWRKGKKKTVKVTLAPLPDNGDGKKSPPKKKKKAEKKTGDLGLGFQDMDPTTAARLGIKVIGGKYPGLIVTSIQPESPLYALGIERGDVILKVGGKFVFKPAHVLDPVRKAKKGDVVVLYVKGPELSSFVTYTP
jgi:serine protease Do